MRLQEQITELKKVVKLLEKSKEQRLKGGKHTEAELNYQIDCCTCAVNSLERLLKLKDDVTSALSTLKNFNFEMIQ